MNPILAYIGFGPDGGIHEYCEQDALSLLFAGHSDLLESVNQGTNTTFLDSRGHYFSLVLRSEVGSALYPGGSFSLEGVYCDACGAELLAPVELPF